MYRTISSMWLSRVTGKSHKNTLAKLRRIIEHQSIRHSPISETDVEISPGGIFIDVLRVGFNIAVSYLACCNTRYAQEAIEFLEGDEFCTDFNPKLTPGCFVFLVQKRGLCWIHSGKSLNNNMNKLMSKHPNAINLLHVISTDNIPALIRDIRIDIPQIASYGRELIVRHPNVARLKSLYPADSIAHDVMDKFQRRIFNKTSHFFPINTKT